VKPKEWVIGHGSLGNLAKVAPLDSIRYIGKILDDTSLSLKFQDATSKELGKTSINMVQLEELADRLKRQLPDIEFNGDYLYTYDKVRRSRSY